jgi:hypothetical protein
MRDGNDDEAAHRRGRCDATCSMTWRDEQSDVEGDAVSMLDNAQAATACHHPPTPLIVGRVLRGA